VIEDAPTLDAESAMVLDGLAVGVDHLEAIVVVLASVGHPYASWLRSGVGLSVPRIAVCASNVLETAERTALAIEADAESRGTPPVTTLESARRVTFVHRVRSFGVAVVFEREAPLGFARMAARQIVRTLEQELPYASAAREPYLVPEARPTAPSAPPARSDLEFDGHEPAPDTQHQARSAHGDRARSVIKHVEEHAADGHIARTRLALRSGLGLDALANPDALGSEALLVLETAAEDILGVEPGKLAEVLA
jgi:hypothetical protein